MMASRRKKASIPIEELLRSQSEILAAKYEISLRTVARYKKEAHISKPVGQYKPNLSLFSSWNQDMAYILGFFAADGCISIENSGRAISVLSSKDKEHLKIIADMLYIDGRRLYRGSGDVWVLQMGKELTRHLLDLGMTPRKSKTLQWPSCILNEFERHFVRGFFDGDGSVCETTSGKHRKSPRLHATFCTGSSDFANALSEYLTRQSITHSLSHGKTNIFLLNISKKDAVLKFYHLLYNDAHLYLERKKAIFDTHLARPTPKVGRPKGRKWSNQERYERMKTFYENIPSRVEIERLYFNERLTLQEIGEIFGCSREKVRRWMQYYEIPRRRRFQR